MKVEGARDAEAHRSAPKQPFGQVLKKVAGHNGPAPGAGIRAQNGAAPIRGIRSTAVTAHGAQLASTENLTRARTAMNAQAALLREVRSEGQSQNEQKMNARVLDLIVKELAADLRADPAPSPGVQAAADTRAPVEASAPAGNGIDAQPQTGTQTEKSDGAQLAQSKAQAAAALVARIETFLKSNRPALAVTLGGAINARVEVERTGPGEVSLKVQGTRGPPPPEDLARIREAVRARGLKLSSLSVT